MSWRKTIVAIGLFLALIATLIWLSRRLLGERLSISGQVMTCGHGGKPWPEGSKLEMHLIDRDRDVYVGHTTITPVPAGPVPFEIFYWENQVRPNGSYVVNGVLLGPNDEGLCGPSFNFVNVITRGSPTRDIVVQLGSFN